MFTLISKHRTLCALICALLAMIAAPYLIPENPDSAVFRSGTLGLILLLASILPAERALARHSQRELAFGFAFGLVFAICLSLGSELAVYGQLLPGLGSLARRVAIPLMATPLFGLLASYAFAFAPHPIARTHKPLPYLFFFAAFVLCYGAVLLALYPGVISYDFEHEIAQFTSGVYEAAHPVFHTVLLGSLYALGESLFGSMTAGAALYSAVQLLLLAAMYAYTCCFVQKRVPSRAVILALTACFALLPFHGVLAVSTAKDPLFAGLCVLLCIFLWEIAEAPAAFLSNRARQIRFIACCLGLALLRHNGVFTFLPACLGVFLLGQGQRRRAALTAIITLFLCFLVPKGLEAAAGAAKTPSSELMSVPCQQLMRTAEYADLTEEEYAEINSWFSDATFRYRAHCADPAKGGNFAFSRYQKNYVDYWRMYIKYGLRYPRIYIEAFLENCVGLWYPDDISHAHSLSNEENEYIYLNTTYPFAPETYAIEPGTRLPALQALLYAFTHKSIHQKYAFLAPFFCPAIYTFLLLYVTLLLRCRRIKRLALSTVPIWGIFLSLLFSAGIFIRYTYPIMAALPVLLVLTLFSETST